MSVGTLLQCFRRKLLQFEWSKTVSNLLMSRFISLTKLCSATLFYTLLQSKFRIRWTLTAFPWQSKQLVEYVWVIDQMSGQHGWILAHFFACLWTDTRSRGSINSQNKERDQYPVILTEQTWLIKDLLHGFRGNFFLRDTAGSLERTR